MQHIIIQMTEFPAQFLGHDFANTGITVAITTVFINI